MSRDTPPRRRRRSPSESRSRSQGPREDRKRRKRSFEDKRREPIRRRNTSSISSNDDTRDRKADIEEATIRNQTTERDASPEKTTEVGA